MKAKSVFDIIKKQNGERFAKAIRAYDNGIFDVPNLLQIVKYAGRDAEPIMPYLVSLKDIHIEEHGVYQSPIELLKAAGYNAYYADTLEKQNAISHYYADREKLCTFKDPTRFEKYYIINAVKENVDEVKRENFPHPEREDEYGTSVLSIQILKKGGFISIKNRYNHTVENPDNTLNSNPDKIIPGLSESLKHYFNVDFSAQKVELPKNYAYVRNKIIQYNQEINNGIFGENYYVKDGVVHELNKDHELMLDYFVLDLKNKTVQNPSRWTDCFGEVLGKEIAGKKLQIITNESGHKCLLADGVQLLELDKGKIINVNLPTTKEIGNYFLYWNKSVRFFNTPQLEKIGYSFLLQNKDLISFNGPKLKAIEDNFLTANTKLRSFYTPQLEKIGDFFLLQNKDLKSFNGPKLKRVGDYFLFSNTLHSFDAPQLKKIGNNFLYYNEDLTSFNAPHLPEEEKERIYKNNPKLSQTHDDKKQSRSALSKLLSKLAIVGTLFSSEKKKVEKPGTIAQSTVSRSRQTNDRSRTN